MLLAELLQAYQLLTEHWIVHGQEMAERFVPVKPLVQALLTCPALAAKPMEQWILFGRVLRLDTAPVFLKGPPRAFVLAKKQAEAQKHLAA